MPVNMSELVSRAKNFWKTGAPEFGFHVSQCRDLHRCKHHTEQLALQIMTVKHARGLRSCPHIRFVFFAESLTCPMAARSELTVMRLCFFSSGGKTRRNDFDFDFEPRNQLCQEWRCRKR